MKIYLFLIANFFKLTLLLLAILVPFLLIFYRRKRSFFDIFVRSITGFTLFVITCTIFLYFFNILNGLSIKTISLLFFGSILIMFRERIIKLCRLVKPSKKVVNSYTLLFLTIFAIGSYQRLKPIFTSLVFPLRDTYRVLAGSILIEDGGSIFSPLGGYFLKTYSMFISFLHFASGIPNYYITKFIGPLIGVLGGIVFYCLVLKITKRKDVSILSFLFYFCLGTKTVLGREILHRQVQTMPQEFALLFMFIMFYFLITFLKSKKTEDLLFSFIAFILISIIHPTIVMLISLVVLLIFLLCVFSLDFISSRFFLISLFSIISYSVLTIHLIHYKFLNQTLFNLISAKYDLFIYFSILIALLLFVSKRKISNKLGKLKKIKLIIFFTISGTLVFLCLLPFVMDNYEICIRYAPFFTIFFILFLSSLFLINEEFNEKWAVLIPLIFLLFLPTIIQKYYPYDFVKSSFFIDTASFRFLSAILCLFMLITNRTKRKFHRASSFALLVFILIFFSSFGFPTYESVSYFGNVKHIEVFFNLKNGRNNFSVYSVDWGNFSPNFLKILCSDFSLDYYKLEENISLPEITENTFFFLEKKPYFTHDSREFLKIINRIENRKSKSIVPKLKKEAVNYLDEKTKINEEYINKLKGEKGYNVYYEDDETIIFSKISSDY